MLAHDSPQVTPPTDGATVSPPNLPCISNRQFVRRSSDLPQSRSRHPPRGLRSCRTLGLNTPWSTLVSVNSSERRSQFAVIDRNCRGVLLVSASDQNRSDVHAVAADAVVRVAPSAGGTFNEAVADRTPRHPHRCASAWRTIANRRSGTFLRRNGPSPASLRSVNPDPGSANPQLPSPTTLCDQAHILRPSPRANTFNRLHPRPTGDSGNKRRNALKR